MPTKSNLSKYLTISMFPPMIAAHIGEHMLDALNVSNESKPMRYWHVVRSPEYAANDNAFWPVNWICECVQWIILQVVILVSQQSIYRKRWCVQCLHHIPPDIWQTDDSPNSMRTATAYWSLHPIVRDQVLIASAWQPAHGNLFVQWCRTNPFRLFLQTNARCP